MGTELEKSTPRIIFIISFTGAEPKKTATAQERAKHKHDRAFYTCKSEWNIVDYVSQKEKKKEKNEQKERVEKPNVKLEKPKERSEKSEIRLANLLEKPNFKRESEPKSLKNTEQKNPQTLDILKYANNYKKTTKGIFGLKEGKGGYLVGYLDNIELNEVAQKMQASESIIWHGVVSFEEKFGNSLSEDNIKYMMTRAMPQFLEDSHLDKNNIAWYASVHHNTDNKHCHFFFYEKEPKKIDSKGNLVYSRKGKIDMKAIDNTLVRMNDHFDKPKDMYTIRDQLLQKVRANSGALPESVLSELKELADSLPDGGRLSYNSVHMTRYRPKVDELVQKILTLDKDIFEKHLQWNKWKEKRLNSIENMLGKRQETDLIDKLQTDLNERLGNCVLQAAKKLKDRTAWVAEKQAERKAEWLKNRKTTKGLNKSNLASKILSRKNRTHRVKVFNKLVSNIGNISEQVMLEAEQKHREIAKQIERAQQEG